MYKVIVASYNNYYPNFRRLNCCKLESSGPIGDSWGCNSIILQIVKIQSGKVM